MAKRGMLTRQKSLGVQEDAIKIIEKYCRKKYRNSTLIVGSSLPHELESTSATPDPFQTEAPPMSALPFVNRMSHFPSQHSIDNRLSNVFLTQSTVESRTQASSPLQVSELFHTPIKEEIKPRPTETLVKYLWRLIQFLYEHCGLKDILMVLLIVFYSLLGGLVFYHLEAPEAELQWQLQRNATYMRQLNFTQQITRAMLSSDCRNFIGSANSWSDTEWYDENAFNHCVKRIRYMINLYDHVAGVDPSRKKVWNWDYWNAVFYSWTLLTTIGYGNLSCKTNLGRMVTICYALLGLPLMLIVLNILGKHLFLLLQSIWHNLRMKLKRRTKRLYRFTQTKNVKLMSSEKGLDKNLNGNIHSATEHDYVEEENIEPSDDLDIFETFPLKLALAIVFLYIGLCSVIFRYWESHWDFFTAFYFFFISLSTIGLGDEMPQHPHYAVGFFVFFVIGLSLVSMCFSILQSRIENKYMAAFQMIDDENNKISFSQNLLSIEDMTATSDKNEPVTMANYVTRPGSILLNPNASATLVDVDNNIKWRQNGTQSHEETVLSNGRRISIITSQASEDTTRSAYYRMTSGSSMSSLASTPVFSPTPPVLGAFLARKSSVKRNRVYPPYIETCPEADTNSPGSQTRRRHRSEDSCNLSPDSEKSDWPNISPEMNAAAPLNAPANVVHAGLRSSLFTIPLSVITESEEESKETSRSEKDGQKRRPPPLKLVKAIQEDLSNEGSPNSSKTSSIASDNPESKMV